MASDLDKLVNDSFNEGAIYVLTYLRDEVYGKEIEETDVWQDFIGKGEEDND